MSKRMNVFFVVAISITWLLPSSSPSLAQETKPPPDIYARDNLVAWCIVPFDGKKRGPAARAAMCARLGFKRVAYDWRAEHVPTFEQEILEYKKQGIEYFAFWGVHDDAFRLFEKYDLHPQIWTMIPAPKEEVKGGRVRAAATDLLAIVQRAGKLGCRVGLYNHGGWGGEPKNMVAVCKYLREKHDASHVGIVYNQHHAHAHVKRFAENVALMKPFLLCINLNGMARDGDKQGQKILPLGEGELDVSLLRIIRDSGYVGPIGIIGHTQDDVELRLQDNLDGLEWIRPQLAGRLAGPKPTPRTWSPKLSAPAPNKQGWVVKGNAEYRKPPLTVECRVTLPQRDAYNILVASDSKSSSAHWEIFSSAGTGLFTAYTPGLAPNHTRSNVMLCDGKPHNVAMVYESKRLRLFVDGKMVADQTVESRSGDVVEGGLAIGRLVEGKLSHVGTIDWVRISSVARLSLWTKEESPPEDKSTLLLWSPETTTPKEHGGELEGALFGPTPQHSAMLVKGFLERSKHGDPGRGLMVFSDAKSACLGCHQIGEHGGTVGPSLTDLGKQRKPSEIVESVIWPQRHVRPEFESHMVITIDGVVHKGYIIAENESQIVLRDPTKGVDHRVTIAVSQIDERRKTGSLMPVNLTASMTEQQLVDMLSLLRELGQPDGLPLAQINSVLKHTKAHLHGPATFEFTRAPIHPEQWPNHTHHINRDRLYDFYAKEADHFRALAEGPEPLPSLLMEFPGIDGGTMGHWGNQDEQVWASDAWNHVVLGAVQAGIFRGAGATVPRGVCVQLGDDNQLSCCFNPDTLSYDAIWKDGFLKFSSVRHGFLGGVSMDGTSVPHADRGNEPKGKPVAGKFRYKGFYRIGRRVTFVYHVGGRKYLDSPSVENGQFVRHVALFDQDRLAKQLADAPRRWPQTIQTTITHGGATPYAVDKIGLPMDNPWRVPIFAGGVGFLADGSALVCTMHGDVWRVRGFRYPSRQASWTRYASGLHHCQGLVVSADGVFVLGRDQITRLWDLNDDGEADYYECFSNAFVTSPAGHDFVCGLERDKHGNFYLASGNQGIVRISADGEMANVVATGFRNPDGIGMTSDGVITVPCSEGRWTPATMICAFRPGTTEKPPYFGYGGPVAGTALALPLVYLPRGIDNSAGGQKVVKGDRWGPLEGQLLHFSFGAGSHFLVLRDEIDGQMQGAIVPLPGDFASGIHRGCFNDEDGQLYVVGMQGWGSYTPQHGCLQRVRYTGQEVQLPVGIRTYRNGVLIEFSAPLETDVAGTAKSHFAQCWNYRYSVAYGSPEFSTRHFGTRGHDLVVIKSAHVVGDKLLFLEMPEIQPVNQLHLSVASAKGVNHQLFVTVHKLRKDSYTNAAGLQAMDKKTVHPHPMSADLAMATRRIPNPHARRKKNGRVITIDTGTNLTFAQTLFRVKPGELIEFTLANPDVVPHNWVLLKPGTLRRVGEQANRLISDPEAAIRQYVPQTSDVLAFTDIVMPKDQFTIYFNAPTELGRYPYLCTFPGHWLVMNGEMIVE